MAALVVPFACLLHPAVHWVTWWLYHPDSLAITPLLFAWWLARSGAPAGGGGSTRWTWTWLGVCLLVAMSCKEDVSLAVLAIGVVLVARGQRRPAAVGLAGIGWFALCSKVVIPWRNDQIAPFYESYFPSWARRSATSCATSCCTPPGPSASSVGRARATTRVKMLGPLGFVVTVPRAPGLLVTGPQLGVNLLVEVQNGATIKSQYASIPIVGLFLGLAEGLALLRSRPAARRASSAMVVPAALGHPPLGARSPRARRRAGATGAAGPRRRTPTARRPGRSSHRTPGSPRPGT